METNNVDMAQLIIDAIQRDEFDDNVKSAIAQADEFLLGKGEKPEFYDDFINKTLSDLKTTINGCIKTRNNAKKKDDLKKYKEGYFNEIVQNANDVVWKVKDIEKPVVTVDVSKEGQRYTVKCTYPDNGFSLENIYGFCTRGNSDKKSENGQEGMYGIGIKSLFCFVDEFKIDSNILIHVNSSDNKKLNHAEITEIKKQNKDCLETSLSFSFTYDQDEEKNKHAGFNTKKLKELIDAVYEEDTSEDRFEKFLFRGKDDEMVFDARSLFFTELRGERTKENSIKGIVFRKDGEELPVLTIDVDEKEIQGDAPGNVCKIAEIKNHYQYIVFHYKKDQISIAFEYNQKEFSDDRIYSTYFIGTYENKTPLLGRKTGCLVNTTAINSSRSGLERENEKSPEILTKIMGKGRESVKNLCLLIENDSENNKVCLDVLCQLLYIFRNAQESTEDGLIPQYIFEDPDSNSNQYVSNSVKHWKFSGNKKYILKEEDGIENGTVIAKRPIMSDENNIRNLYNVYRKYIVPNEEKSDVIIYEDENYQVLTEGVKHLCNSFFQEHNNSWIGQMHDLPFLKNVKDAITRRIDGNVFSSVKSFFDKADEKDHLYIKQLIARYEVNDFFDYMGNYSNGNLRNWLFDNSVSGNEEWTNEYINSYSALKAHVKDSIQEAQYYYSLHGNASADWWYDKYRPIPFKEAAGYENDIMQLQLLHLIVSSILFIGKCMDNNFIWLSKERRFIKNDFVHDKGGNIKLRNRYRRSTTWDGKFKYFSLDILGHSMVSFDNFRMARDYIDQYNEKQESKGYELDYIKRCNIKEIKLSDLSNVFKWLATYPHMDKLENGKAINISKINFEEQKSSDTELIRFTKMFIEEEVFIKTNKLSINNNGRHFIGFITNLNENKTKIHIKTSANDAFKQIGEADDQSEKKYLLVYSSYDDEQSVLAKVMEHLGYGEDVCAYINHFIKTGNVRELPSAVYNKLLKRRRLEYDYPFTYEEMTENEINKNLSIEKTYDLLSGKMSYDGHCPICNAIPTLNIKDKDINKSERRNCLVAMLAAQYQGKYTQYQRKNIYVKIVCCKSCFEEYKDTLTEAVIEDIEGKDYKRMILKSTISSSIRSRDLKQEILISPDNWEIICQFNHMIP